MYESKRLDHIDEIWPSASESERKDLGREWCCMHGGSLFNVTENGFSVLHRSNDGMSGRIEFVYVTREA